MTQETKDELLFLLKEALKSMLSVRRQGVTPGSPRYEHMTRRIAHLRQCKKEVQEVIPS